MAWDKDLWVGATAQGGFYALSGPLGVLLQVFTIVALIVLAVLLRRHNVSGAPFTIAAAVMFAIGLLVWWIFVYPVNVELAKWVNGPVPDDWADWRRAVGVGPGGERARSICRLCRAHRLGAGDQGEEAQEGQDQDLSCAPRRPAPRAVTALSQIHSNRRLRGRPWLVFEAPLQLRFARVLRPNSSPYRLPPARTLDAPSAP